MMDIRTLVFDFDGTLATCPYDFERMRESVLLVAASHGIDPLQLGTKLGLLETIDLGVERLAANQQQADRFRREATASLCAIEYEAAAYTVLLPGVVEALHRLRAAGYRLGIITRNSAAAVTRIIGETHLPVEHILSREDVPHPKPHPDHVRRMLDLLETVPPAAFMVGDHPMDIDTGRAAGMGTVAVLTGQTDEATLRAARPDYLFPSVCELSERLLQGL